MGSTDGKNAQDRGAEHPKLARLAALVVDLSAIAGMLVLLTGGLRLRHVPYIGKLSITFYGPFFLPLAICLAWGLRPAGSRTVPWVVRAAAAFDALSARKQQLWLLITIALGLLAHGLIVLLKYYSFQSAMDLAIYANACHGALFSTMKGDVWLFADHFEPLLLLFTPLCRSFSPAISLLVVQTIGWGVGAFGIFVLARHQRYRPCIAWLCTALYLNLSGNVTIAYYDFHLLSLALALIPWLWWAVAAERYGALVLLVLVYLGLKESAALSLIGLGAFLALDSNLRNVRNAKRRYLGLAFVAVGAVTFVVIITVVYPAFRDGEGTMYFAKYYGHLGKSLPEVVQTAFTRPVYFAYQLLKPRKLVYLFRLFAPFLFFPLRYPRYLLPVLPAILVNILSNQPSMYSAGYHYEAEIFPALFAMAVIAFSGRTRLQSIWLACVLVAFTSASPLAVARLSLPTPPQRRLAKLLAEHVPQDRAIAAPQRVAAHLTDRARLYMFDYWQMEDDWKRADIVVVGFHGRTLGWYPWQMLESQKLPKMLPGLRLLYQDAEDPRFRVFEVLPSAAQLPSIAHPLATPQHPNGK